MNRIDHASRPGLLFLLGLLALLAGPARSDDIHTRLIAHSNVTEVREAVIEAIVSAGLVVSATIPFNRMLERTGEALGQGESPYAAAETVQFCSARLAWQLVHEDPTQLALCPMSITIYATRTAAQDVHIAYRSPGQSTPGRRRGEQLLQEIVEQAAELATWH